jgi:ATP-binding cassette, subfamily C, bacterial
VNRAPSTFRVLRRFVVSLFVASPRQTVESVVLTVGVGLFEGVGLLLLIPLLQLIGLDAQQGSLGSLLSGLRAGFAAVGITPTLPLVLALYVGVIALQSTLQRRQAVVHARLRADVVHAWRDRMYRAIAGSTWVYYSRNRSSSFLQLLTDKIENVAAATYNLIDLIVTAGISMVYIAMALRVSAPMTLLVMASGALLALALRGSLDRARQAGRAYWDASARLHAATSDFLESMKIAKGYGAEERHAAEFGRLSRTLGETGRVAAHESSQARQWLSVGSACLLAVTVYIAHGLAGMSPASLFLLMFLFARLVPRLTSLYERSHSLAIELPGFEVLAAAEEAALAAAEPRVAEHGLITLQRGIELRDVSFSYTETGEPVVLKNVQLSIAARATTAIVGPSGAGKSTIADLMMGLVLPTAGVVAVDGVPLTPDLLRAWRQQIGYVPQETLLFHDTILANLRWANPDATEDDVWRAIAMAAADDFVKALPDRLHTILGDRGVLVSGGERQRLSLARALLRRPRLLILDEATSSLDSENERRIQHAIEQLHEQITIVIITHRLSTIRNADVIHVIDRGELVESGSWDSLVGRQSSRFRDLCQAQGIERDKLSTTEDTEDTEAIFVKKV